MDTLTQMSAMSDERIFTPTDTDFELPKKALLFSTKKMVMFHKIGFAPIFPDTFYHLTHYWPAAADIPV
ncbi:hypothetical protein, partial [Klebsiella pneumoniae]|uniref:hypothetical protein n=1 Tax=Klebsiella pneumoniae TaxID=573 RepID=UPI003D091614